MNAPDVPGTTPAIFTGLLDDAAIFPPGNLPLSEAVSAHLAHRCRPYADLVGPFVISADRLPSVRPLISHLERNSLRVSLTAPVARLGAVMETLEAIPTAYLSSVEVAAPEGMTGGEAVALLSRAWGARSAPAYLELPRDNRQAGFLEALAGTTYHAKLRTGGVRVDLYPSERELASTITALASRNVSFKATAGLHHAIRNTDSETGFEQHGFLNLLNAVHAIADGADTADALQLLAERAANKVVATAQALTPLVRRSFRSFGTCSISEPVDDLVNLGLITPGHLSQEAGR